MREKSPFSDRQAIKKRKEKKSKSTLCSCEEFVCDNHREKWLLPFPCEHEKLNFLRELNFADGRKMPQVSSLSVDFLAAQQLVTHSLRVPRPCPRTEKGKKTTSGSSYNEIPLKKLASSSEHKL